MIGYREKVTSLEIVLVMAGAPLAIIVLVGLLTLGPHVVRTRRSLSGPKSNHPPVLWTASPEEVRGGSANHQISGALPRGDRGDL